MSKLKPNKPNKPQKEKKKVLNSRIAMATSMSLRDRIAACVAAETNAPADPVGWASERMWQFSVTPGWEADWDYAMRDDNAHNFNPDTGRRTDVISDEKILARVQQLLGE